MSPEDLFNMFFGGGMGGGPFGDGGLGGGGGPSMLSPICARYLTDNLCAQFLQHHSAKAAFAQRASDSTVVQVKQMPLPKPLAQC
jgi:hypothetical protein